MRYKTGTRRLDRMRDRGATAVEFTGLTILACLIVAAVVATPVAKTMSNYTGDIVDKILATNDDITTTDGVGNVDAAGAPTEKAAIALQYAMSQVGKAPYVWGAKGPNAFDCSGLMYWAYGKAGVTIMGSSQTQWASTPHVPGGTGAKLLPGDLVFFHIDGNAQAGANHVAMYAGKGMVVSASTSHAPLHGDPSQTQIRYVSLASFGSSYMGATRPTGGGTAQA